MGGFSPEGDFPSPSSEVAWLTLSCQAAMNGVSPRSAATSLQPPPHCSCLGCGKDETSAQWCRAEITEVLGKLIKPMISCSSDHLQVNTSVLPPAHLPCSTFTSKSNNWGQCPAKLCGLLPPFSGVHCSIVLLPHELLLPSAVEPWPDILIIQKLLRAGAQPELGRWGMEMCPQSCCCCWDPHLAQAAAHQGSGWYFGTWFSLVQITFLEIQMLMLFWRRVVVAKCWAPTEGRRLWNHWELIMSWNLEGLVCGFILTMITIHSFCCTCYGSPPVKTFWKKNIVELWPFSKGWRKILRRHSWVIEKYYDFLIITAIYRRENYISTI